MTENLPFPFKNGITQLFNNFFEPAGTVFVPPLDVFETQEGYTLTLELPGLSSKDVAVECEKGELVIRGEKKWEAPKGSEVVRAERVLGTFERRITLSDLTDETKITASMKDGVLSIHLPKKPEAKPRTIQIEVK